MNRLRSVGAASALAALAMTGALAACGGDESGDDYVDRVNDLQIAYVEDVAGLVAEGTPTSPDEIAAMASELAGLTDGVADDIGAVEPPDDVSDLHADLVEGLHGIATRIADAGAALASGDRERAAEAATSLQEATNAAQGELDGLIDEINATLGEE